MVGRLAISLASLSLSLVLAGDSAALAQTGRIHGVVRDADGKPIRGATVVAENPDATPSSFTVTTDERGRWAVIGLRAGAWRFTASAEGFEESTATGRIEPIATSPTLEFTLARDGDDDTGAPGAPANAVETEVALAEQLMSEGKFEEAVAAFETAVSHAPAAMALKVRLGQALRAARELDRAVAVLESVPDEDAACPDARRELGLAWFDKGDVERADAVLTRAAAERGAGRDLFFALGEVKLARALAREAVTWYEKAAAADPAWPRPLLKLGLVAANAGDREAAARYLERVLALAPDSLEAKQAGAILAQFR